MGTISTFMAILAQLFWAVTIGALTATFSLITKWLAAGVVLGGGWWLLKRRKLWAGRKKLGPPPPPDP